MAASRTPASICRGGFDAASPLHLWRCLLEDWVFVRAGEEPAFPVGEGVVAVVEWACTGMMFPVQDHFSSKRLMVPHFKASVMATKPSSFLMSASLATAFGSGARSLVVNVCSHCFIGSASGP